MADRPVILSYGGGVQTVALCCLIREGRLPRPERIVIADTSREASSTWQYTDAYMRPMMRTMGLEIEIAPHSLATVDLFDKKDRSKCGPLPALFAPNGVRLSGYCSVEWKRRVVHRYLRSIGYGPEHPVRMWLGISTDELRRARTSSLLWVEHWWPLIMDIPTSRAGCLAIIEKTGLPEPERSSCWMCPNRGDKQWQRLKEKAPDDFAKAVACEREIRATTGFDDLYLHHSCQPLDEIDFIHNPGQLSMDLECNSGECWV